MLAILSESSGGFSLRCRSVEPQARDQVELRFSLHPSDSRRLTCDAQIEIAGACIEIGTAVFGSDLATFCTALDYLHASNSGSVELELCDADLRVEITMLDLRRGTIGLRGSFRREIPAPNQDSANCYLKGEWGTIISDQSYIPKFLADLQREITSSGVDTRNPML